jgi:hypothetical protein
MPPQLLRDDDLSPPAEWLAQPCTPYMLSVLHKLLGYEITTVAVAYARPVCCSSLAGDPSRFAA